MARSAGGTATYVAYRAGAVLARAIPPAVAEPAARGVGRVLSRTLATRRAMVIRHQQRARGHALAPAERRAAVAGTFDSYARYWVELFRLPYEMKSDLDARFTIEGYEHVAAALEKGSGVILALPHLGGWEYAGAWMHAVKHHRMLVVVEPVQPPELFEWFARVRADMGMEVVPVGPDAAPRALGALRDNRIVCLVADRDLSGDGVDVEFFGEHTTLPGGPATLALRSGAALLPVACYFGPRRTHRTVVLAPIDTSRGTGKLRDDVARITQDLTHAFEALIRAAPDQWHLLQPNWPSDRASS